MAGGRAGALSGGTETGTPREAGKGPHRGRSMEGMRFPRRRRRTAGPRSPATPKGGPTVTLRAPGPPRSRGPGRVSPGTVRKQKTPRRPSGRPRAEGRTAGRRARQAQRSLPPTKPRGPAGRLRSTEHAKTVRAAAPGLLRQRPRSSAPPPRARSGGCRCRAPVRALPSSLPPAAGPRLPGRPVPRAPRGTRPG